MRGLFVLKLKINFSPPKSSWNLKREGKRDTKHTETLLIRLSFRFMGRVNPIFISLKYNIFHTQINSRKIYIRVEIRGLITITLRAANLTKTVPNIARKMKREFVSCGRESDTFDERVPRGGGGKRGEQEKDRVKDVA